MEDMRHQTSTENGIALLITLLLIFVFTMMTLGFYYMVTGEQRIAVSDRDNTVAFYGAQAGLEKMSADLAAWFVSHASPTPAQIDSLTTASYIPSVPGIAFPPGGYKIAYQTNADGSLKSSTQMIGGTGPLVGLQGIVTPLTLTVISRGPNMTEVKFTRSVQEVAVPAFQFGIFSENDLSFFAGPPFDFGGRVHTNSYLYLASGSTLTLSDKSTAYKEVIRSQLSNGWSTSTNYTGDVNVVITPGTYGNLAQSDGSVVGGPGSAPNPNWPTISLSTYNGNIRTKLTGARKLNLALALGGGTPIDIIRRPPSGEDPTSTVGSARFFNQASLRILLSDSPGPITSLPGITSTQPFPLDQSIYGGPPYNLPAADACHPPLAQSRGYAVDHDYMSPPGTSLLSGAATSYIKIEIQLNANPGTWQDVTGEILKLGISKDVGTGCTNKSIIHLQRLRPIGSPPADPTLGSIDPKDYIPINLYDPREGEVRDISQSGLALGGVMNVIELDVHNLQLWFANTLDPVNAPSGALALNSSGYIVYTSDRRGDRDSGGNETGEYGFEDIINPTDPNGTPNGTLDPAEDVNANGFLDVYGGAPHYLAIDNSPGSTWPAFFSPTPPTPIAPRITASQAQKNSVLFFRRALRLVNGVAGKLPPLAHANCTNPNAGGFTVASENPVYLLGDYNADPTNGFTDTATACHVPASVIGDAVTLLSDAFQDSNSFKLPTSFGDCTSSPNRCAATTYYRTAIVGGKNNSFAKPSWPGVGQDFGTDGGAHNFLRYIENWGGKTLFYRGSLVSFYTSRQAVGIYKCCKVVYSPPTRTYKFDIDFTNIGLLPPGTPRFSDVNALSFKQSILPNQ